MNEIIRGEILPSEILVSETELTARLGRPASSEDPDIKAALFLLSEIANIRFVATRVKILGIKNGEVSFESFSVNSSALAHYLSGCTEAVMFMITLGSEVDRLIMKRRALSLSSGFLFDGVASALAEAACDEAEKKICSGKKTKPRFSPGYADCPLSVQHDFMKVLSADKYIGIKLLDSLLMTPMKSVSAFVALPRGEK